MYIPYFFRTLLYSLIIVANAYSAQLINNNEVVEICNDYVNNYNPDTIKKFDTYTPAAQKEWDNTAQKSSINFHTHYKTSNTQTQRAMLNGLVYSITKTQCLNFKDTIEPSLLKNSAKIGSLHAYIEHYETKAFEVRKSFKQRKDDIDAQSLENWVNAESRLVYSTHPLSNIHRYIRKGGAWPSKDYIQKLFAIRHVIESNFEQRPLNPSIINYYTRTYYPEHTTSVEESLLNTIKNIILKSYHPIIELQKQKLLIALALRKPLYTAVSDNCFYFFATDPDGNCGYYTIGTQYESKVNHNDLRIKELIKNNSAFIDMGKLEERFNNQTILLQSNHPASYYSHHTPLETKFIAFKNHMKTKNAQVINAQVIEDYIDDLYKNDGNYNNPWWFTYYRMKEFLAAYFLDIDIWVWVQSSADQKLHYIGPQYTHSTRKQIHLFTDNNAIHDTILAPPTDLFRIAHGMQHEKEKFFPPAANQTSKDILCDTGEWMQKETDYKTAGIKPSDLRMNTTLLPEKNPTLPQDSVDAGVNKNKQWYFPFNILHLPIYCTSFFNNVKSIFTGIGNYIYNFWAQKNN